MGWSLGAAYTFGEIGGAGAETVQYWKFLQFLN